MTLVSQADQMPIKVEEEVNPGPMLNSGYSSGSSTSSTNAAGRKKKKSLNTDKKYLSIQCTGYLKSWPLTKVIVLVKMVTNLMVMTMTMILVIKVGLEPETSHGAEEGDPESCMSCLVAVGKIQPSFQVIMMRMTMIHSPYEYGVHFESCSALNKMFFLQNASCLKTFAADNN